MTREEAYKLLKYGMCLNREGYMVIRPGCQKEYFEAVDMGIAALRGPTREMVERMFPGCDFCKKELDDYPYIVAHSDYSSSDTCYEPGYCPICSRPLTDEAVEMVVERMEALYD